MTKGKLRAARKAAAAAGQPWTVEVGASGLEIVRERTPTESRRHTRVMHQWARNYDRLNGAPENAGDR